MFTRNEFFEQRNAEIAADYSRGDDLGVMAVKYGLSQTAIRQIACRHGGGRPNKGLRDLERAKRVCDAYSSGRSLQDVGREFDISGERVRQILVASRVDERHDGFGMPRRVAARERAEIAAREAEGRRAQLAADAAQVRELYDAGLSYENIAAKCGRGVSWVQKTLWKTGGPARNARTGNLRVKFSDEARAEILHRYAAGDSVLGIAEDFGIGAAQVFNLAHSHGVKRPAKVVGGCADPTE